MNIEFNKTYYAKKEFDVETMTGTLFTINVGDAVKVWRIRAADEETIFVFVSNSRCFYLTKAHAERIFTDEKPIDISFMYDEEIAKLLKRCAKRDCTCCSLRNISRCGSQLYEEAAKRLGGKK